MEIYENMITLGDFNMTVENPRLNAFMLSHGMFHFINEPTCFQSHDPTCISNILTNIKTIFRTSKTFERSLLKHHK